MKLVSALSSRHVFSVALLLAAMLLIPATARAAELVMFESAGCPWCATFDREIAPIYGKTEEGRRAPLRRVDIDKPLPAELAFIAVERLTPLFVLVDRGHEIGRIRGYPGDANFWGLLGVLIKRLDATKSTGGRAQLMEKRIPVES